MSFELLFCGPLGTDPSRIHLGPVLTSGVSLYRPLLRLSPPVAFLHESMAAGRSGFEEGKMLRIKQGSIPSRIGGEAHRSSEHSYRGIPQRSGGEVSTSHKKLTKERGFLSN